MKRVPTLIILTAFLAVILSGCSKGEYPNPTREYYVNDYADALLAGTRATIISEGERLMEYTEDIDDNGGAQVVVATFLLEEGQDIESIDRSDLFNQWRIGKNDMGVLILLIFESGEDELGEYLGLVKTEIEIGLQMEQYISAAEAADLIDYCLYNPEWEGSIDMGLIEMYYEILSIIYTEAYGYESFNYDMEVYRQYLIEYPNEDEEAQIPMSLIVYLFSPYSSFWSKFFVILGIVLISITGGGLLFGRNRGGGGRSGGYGIRR